MVEGDLEIDGLITDLNSMIIKEARLEGQISELPTLPDKFDISDEVMKLLLEQKVIMVLMDLT